MDASTRLDTYTADDIIRMAGTFAADPEEGETQAAPAEQAKGFQSNREHILIVEINTALHHVNNKNDPTEKHRRAAGRRLLEARDTVAPEKWERWCKAHINLSFDRITKLTDSVERIRGSNRIHMAKKRAEEQQEAVQAVETKPVDFNELIQAGIEATTEEANVFDMPFADRFKALDDAAQEPIAAQPDATGNVPCREQRSEQAEQVVETEQAEQPQSEKAVEVDNQLRHGATCLAQARKIEARAVDLKITAQCDFRLAKIAWVEEVTVSGSRETWEDRCLKVIPHVAPRTVRALINDKKLDAGSEAYASADEQEADIKALSEQHGLTYYPPEKRDQIAQWLERADALMRKNRAKAAASDRHHGEQQSDDVTGNEPCRTQPTSERPNKPQRMTGDHKALFDQWVELGRRMTEDELRDILVRASKALDKARAKGSDPRPDQKSN